MNIYLLKVILDSKKNLDYSKFSRKQLEFILDMTIQLYRKEKSLVDILKKY